MELKIAGWQKLSLIDYPGKVSAVLFLAGCNLRCHYCHNHDILDARANCLPLEDVLAELRVRRKWLDAVVVSGGEPTVSPLLVPILQSLRMLGLLIKLDTNGTRPEILRTVIEDGLVDYVALDVKATPAKHVTITGQPMDAVLQSIAYLKTQTRVPYMFRTTVSPLLTAEDLVEIGQNLVNGAPVWQIQQCRTENAYSAAKIREMVDLVKKHVQHIVVAGL